MPSWIKSVASSLPLSCKLAKMRKYIRKLLCLIGSITFILRDKCFQAKVERRNKSNAIYMSINFFLSLIIYKNK